MNEMEKDEKSVRQLKTMDDLPLDGKQVLVRVDFNVPVGEDDSVGSNEDYKIEAAINTIDELRQRRCKIILVTHLGRPSEKDGDFNLAPIHRRLEELLKSEVRMLKHLYGDDVKAVVAGIEPGSVVMLPNVRLDEREVSNNEDFARELAEIGDVFVNEAFSVCHRNHASVALVPKILSSCAGRRTVEEYDFLNRLANNPEHPYVAITGGAKVETKVSLLRELLKKVDKVCVGGKIANTFLAATGRSKIDHIAENELVLAKCIWEEAEGKIVLPSDVVISVEENGREKIMTVKVADIPEKVNGVWDVGPETVSNFVKICEQAKTVMWNGPLGKFEDPDYAKGTYSLAKELAKFDNRRVVGGGDTINAIEGCKVVEKYDHVSVGGGAMIAFLEGSSMPGLELLFKV
jgi:phosphoglycerate kinase